MAFHENLKHDRFELAVLRFNASQRASKDENAFAEGVRPYVETCIARLTNRRNLLTTDVEDAHQDLVLFALGLARDRAPIDPPFLRAAINRKAIDLVWRKKRIMTCSETVDFHLEKTYRVEFDQDGFETQFLVQQLCLHAPLEYGEMLRVYEAHEAHPRVNLDRIHEKHGRTLRRIARKLGG